MAKKEKPFGRCDGTAAINRKFVKKEKPGTISVPVFFGADACVKTGQTNSGVIWMEQKKPRPDRPSLELTDFLQGLPDEPFPLGVYPVFDDDVPRDNEFENFAAPDLRDMRPYPWGLK